MRERSRRSSTGSTTSPTSRPPSPTRSEGTVPGKSWSALHEAGQVAVGVLDRGDLTAAAHVVRLLDDRAAALDQLLDGLLDVLHAPEGDRAGEAALVPVRVEADMPAADREAHV